MSPEEQDEFDFKLLRKTFLKGIDLTYGKLSLCDLKHYTHVKLFKGGRRYQIYCDDPRVSWFKVYYETELNDAVKKFIEIMKKIKPEVR